MNFLTTKETAKKLGIAYGTLANMRMVGAGPLYIKFGWEILYDPRDVEKFIKDRANVKK